MFWKFKNTNVANVCLYCFQQLINSIFCFQSAQIKWGDHLFRYQSIGNCRVKSFWSTHWKEFLKIAWDVNLILAKSLKISVKDFILSKQNSNLQLYFKDEFLHWYSQGFCFRGCFHFFTEMQKLKVNKMEQAFCRTQL